MSDKITPLSYIINIFIHLRFHDSDKRFNQICVTCSEAVCARIFLGSTRGQQSQCLYDLQIGVLALTASSSSHAFLLRPALFSAYTLTKYSLPSCRPVTVYAVAFPSTVPASLYDAKEDLHTSTRYAVMGEPPSESGASQAREIVPGPVSVTLSFLGDWGFSGKGWG